MLNNDQTLTNEVSKPFTLKLVTAILFIISAFISGLGLFALGVVKMLENRENNFIVSLLTIIGGALLVSFSSMFSIYIRENNKEKIESEEEKFLVANRGDFTEYSGVEVSEGVQQYIKKTRNEQGLELV